MARRGRRVRSAPYLGAARAAYMPADSTTTTAGAGAAAAAAAAAATACEPHAPRRQRDGQFCE